MGKTIQITILLITLAITITIYPAKAEDTVSAAKVIAAYKNKTLPTNNPMLALARICVNEEGWHNPRGCAAIWQVVQNVRSKTCNRKRISLSTQCRNGKETSLSAMRRLSKRVTGIIPPTSSQQKWTSTLQANNHAPSGWIECKKAIKQGKKRVSFPTGCHGVWELYSEPWAKVREIARKLYLGQVDTRPCPEKNTKHGPVIAWGYSGDLWLAERRGLIQVDCGDTGNYFFAKPINQSVPKA
jgi:hypothetical protein